MTRQILFILGIPLGLVWAMASMHTPHHYMAAPVIAEPVVSQSDVDDFMLELEKARTEASTAMNKLLAAEQRTYFDVAPMREHE